MGGFYVSWWNMKWFQVTAAETWSNSGKLLKWPEEVFFYWLFEALKGGYVKTSKGRWIPAGLWIAFMTKYSQNYLENLKMLSFHSMNSKFGTFLWYNIYRGSGVGKGDMDHGAYNHGPWTWYWLILKGAVSRKKVQNIKWLYFYL